MKRISPSLSALKNQITVLSTVIVCSLVSTSLAQPYSGRPIGQTTALIPEASTADEAREKNDGQSGDTAFAFGTFKALATIGEIDATTGKVLTGYPDGNGAWLVDNDTIRVVYQSESYATMSSQTYGWEMDSGVKFTGSHIHTIDYNRAKFADFLTSNTSASDMFEGSGNLFNTVYNAFGEVVVPRADGGLWGNQALPDKTHVPFKAGKELTEGDFFFQSFCGAWYEPANKYGVGKGFADNLWFMAEEWNIGSQMFTGGAAEANDTMGLASMVVDIANQTAYTVPALGQTGYEKIMPINPGNTNYVVAVLAGYNHDQSPVPNRIYIGVKGKNVDGTAIDYATASQRDAFLARNGLLYGKIYGLALSNSTYTTLGFNGGTIDATTKMVDTYLKNANATNTFSGRFYPTTYKWAGFDQPKAVKETEMMLWDDSDQQPAGYTFFNGDTKTEHPAVDPDITKFRFVQNMTAAGGLLGFDLSALVTELNNANGNLPEYVSANVTRIVAAVNGALTLEVGGKGVAHPGTLNTSNKTASTHVEAGVSKMVSPDGLLWIKTDDGDFLIVDEDSGNDYGERKYVLQINEANMQLAEANKGYLLALAGGSRNPRALASAAAYNGTFTRATSAEFSGSWNVTGLVAKKQDGSFYTAQELAGTGEQDIISNIKLEKQSLIGTVQMPGESSGAVASGKADYGGQIFLFNMATLPVALQTTGRPIGQTTALIPEASTADDASERIDGQSGDTAFAYGKFKALATIGEVNPTTGKVLTGYPDGNGAWLLDNDTIRVVYQSESYATMSSQTYGWMMNSGVKFTGSHIHTIDYNRAKFADFLTSNTSASDMFEGSGNLFNTVYNAFGEVVVPRANGGLWGNQALPNKTHIPFKAGKELTEGDFFFQSFCGAWYEPANKYGVGKGFADNVWLMAEEWNIGSQMFTGGAAEANDTMGLASMVVDIANQTAYTAPVLGQTGYEKIMPINPGNSNYVVAVLAGYNHDQSPVPNRIYIGVKGKNVDGTAINYATASQRDAFLARNGLLHGRIYGLALSNSTYTTLGFNGTTINATTKMVDTYLKNANATNTFSGRFYPTTYKWAGFNQPKAVKETEMMLWDDSDQQPAGYTFFNGDTKTEHPAVDPDITKFRFVQNMTAAGGLLGFDLSALVTELNNANGDLPAYVSANVTRIVPAINGALTLEVGGKGVAHPGTLNTSNKTASTHVEAEVAKMVSPDGLLWIKTNEGSFLIVDEDSGNDYGERKYVLQINEANMQLAEANKGYLLALAGGSRNPRALASAAAYNGTFTRATSAEFSGSWNVTGLVAKKQDGSFYTAQELAGTGEQDIISNIKLEKQSLIGTVQMPGESSGAVASGKADYGGQIFLFNMATLPVATPTISSPTTASGTAGSPFTYTISASNNGTFNTSTLPPWLSLNSTTGVLSGTPTEFGLVDLILTASNSAGTDTESLRIKVGAETSVFQTIKFLGGASLPTGGEIVDYANGKVLTTNSGNGTHKVEILTVSSSGAFTSNSTSVDLSSVFGGAVNINSISSVLADQRGFGVATVIPTGTGATDLGKIAIFNIESGAILKTLEVGYHPDSVTITPDGTKLVVVNEGEFVSTSAESTFARPGSISVVDISSVTTPAHAGNLTQSKVTTIDFSSVNLASGVSIAGLRNARLDTLTTKTANFADIEPEYATTTNTVAYVTLQENNAIAVFDFATSKYSAIFELGTIEQLIDASDRDGASSATSISINDSVHGLPMADTIANFIRSGSVFLMTANEGDARPDDADIARGSTLTANMTTAVAARATNTGIGRLNLLKFEGDTDNDGKIDLPTMMGTRSFSIWNSANGTLVYDSGSTLELFAAANDPETFNTNSGNLSNTDTRSDDKGPEPEAIAYASLGGRHYAFVGAERQNGIYAFDITNFSKVKVVGYFNTISSTQDSGAAYISPESIKFIRAGTNPSDKNLLVVGYEGTGNNGSVAVFEFAPPASSEPEPTPAPTPTRPAPLAQKPVSSATTREEVKAIVSSKVQEALAKDPVKVKTTGQIAEILGISKGTLSKIAKLAPSLKTEGGKINIAKLEKLIRNNPKAAALLTGNAKIQGGSKKSSVKK